MEWLNYISAFLTSIVAAIGLYFIWKQIKIEKNKDIFFNFQQNLESELNFHSKKNFDFMTEYNELITDHFKRIKNIMDSSPKSYSKEEVEYFEKIDIKQNEQVNNIYLKFWDVFKKYETIFHPKIITLDRWWLGKNYNNLLNIKKSAEYLNHINFTRDILEKFKKNYESDRDNISELRKIIHSEYVLSLNNAKKLEENLNNFLVELAEDKSVL